MIAKEDWKEEIEKGEINIEFLEKYAGAYDVSKAYSLVRIKDYSIILNAYTLLLENKFDLVINFTKLIRDSYLEQFYEFLSSNFEFSKTGRIGNETIKF